MDRGIVHQLLHGYIDGPGHMAHSVRDLLGDHIVLRVALTSQLDVNRRGLTKVKNLADNVGGLEKEFHARESFRQLASQAMNISLGGTMAGFQRHQDLGIGRADRSSIAVGKVDAAIRQSDIVQDRVDFFPGNLSPNLLLNLIDKPCRFFDSQTRAAADMKAELSGVYVGEKVAAQEKYQSAG